MQTRTVTVSGIISDLLLWGLIFGAVGLAVYYTWFAIPAKKQQTLEIPFENANEVRRGALVRMMGIEIGYVKDIQLAGDHVTMTLKTYPEFGRIPEGSTFSIDYSGAAGSKTIDVRPPGHEERNQGYFVEDPVRFKEGLEYQIEVANALKDGSENILEFFGKHAATVEQMQENVNYYNRLMDNGSRHLANAKTMLDTKGADLSSGLNKFSNTIDGFSDVSARTANALTPERVGPIIHSNLTNFEMTLKEGHATMVSGMARHRLDQAGDAMQQLQGSIQQVNSKAGDQNPLYKPLDQITETFDRLEAFLTQIPADLPVRVDAWFDSAHKTVHSWKIQTGLWLKALETKDAAAKQAEKQKTKQQKQP